MTKPIEDYTADELSAKIEAIKAEREKTANALKRYEEELERRKQEVPLGIPTNNVSQYKTLYWLNGAGISCKEIADSACDVQLRQCSFLNVFHSKESAEKHAEMLLAWRQALIANSKGEQIDIKVLLPLLPKGWVACDSSGEWFVFSCKPFIRRKAGSKDEGVWDSEWNPGFRGFLPFNLKPAENWEDSLMECGL